MQIKNALEDEHVGRPEAAKFLGLATQTLAVWASTKRYPLPYIKVGSKVRYFKSDLQAFLARNLHNNVNGGA